MTNQTTAPTTEAGFVRSLFGPYRQNINRIFGRDYGLHIDAHPKSVYITPLRVALGIVAKQTPEAFESTLEQYAKANGKHYYLLRMRVNEGIAALWGTDANKDLSFLETKAGPAAGKKFFSIDDLTAVGLVAEYAQNRSMYKTNKDALDDGKLYTDELAIRVAEGAATFSVRAHHRARNQTTFRTTGQKDLHTEMKDFAGTIKQALGDRGFAYQGHVIENKNTQYEAVAERWMRGDEAFSLVHLGQECPLLLHKDLGSLAPDWVDAIDTNNAPTYRRREYIGIDDATRRIAVTRTVYPEELLIEVPERLAKIYGDLRRAARI